MKLLPSSIMALTVLFAMSAQADFKADKLNVDTACAQEAATASCGAEKAGTGLLKCLHTYKQANTSFQFSDACKAAIATLETDRKAKKNSTTSSSSNNSGSSNSK